MPSSGSCRYFLVHFCLSWCSCGALSYSFSLFLCACCSSWNEFILFIATSLSLFFVSCTYFFFYNYSFAISSCIFFLKILFHLYFRIVIAIRPCRGLIARYFLNIVVIVIEAFRASITRIVRNKLLKQFISVLMLLSKRPVASFSS